MRSWEVEAVEAVVVAVGVAVVAVGAVGGGGMPDIKQAPTSLAAEIYPPTFSSSPMSVLSSSSKLMIESKLLKAERRS